LPVARRPEIAARRFLEALGSATSCVTTQRLTTLRTYLTPAQTQTVRFTAPPVSLRAPSGGPRGLLFDVSYIFATTEAPEVVHVRRHWRVVTRMYQYRLFDHARRELLVYHWQPGDEFLGPDHPHVHVSAALSAQIDALEFESIDLGRRHLVTERVSLAAFVRMLIEEFGVAPLRSDWRKTLGRTETIFRDEDPQPISQ
jgi:hypothetical protein